MPHLYCSYGLHLHTRCCVTTTRILTRAADYCTSKQHSMHHASNEQTRQHDDRSLCLPLMHDSGRKFKDRLDIHINNYTDLTFPPYGCPEYWVQQRAKESPTRELLPEHRKHKVHIICTTSADQKAAGNPCWVSAGCKMQEGEACCVRVQEGVPLVLIDCIMQTQPAA